MSQIDLAGAVAAREVAGSRVVTISMTEVIFKEPVFIGDVVSCYARITNVGTTSIKTRVEVVVERYNSEGFIVCVPVTRADVTYVNVDKNGVKRAVDPELKKLHGFWFKILIF